jgi:hypothetical protein
VYTLRFWTEHSVWWIICVKSSEAIMDLGEWLRGLGLDQYEATFKENGVDTEVLPDLTDSDLEKLGVLLGHRKRLLKAIAGAEWDLADRRAGRQTIDGELADADANEQARIDEERRQIAADADEERRRQGDHDPG